MIFFDFFLKSIQRVRTVAHNGHDNNKKKHC